MINEQLPMFKQGPTGAMSKDDIERFVRLEQEATVDTVVMRVKEEILKATAKHGTFPTAHHGYAVILEELDEAWYEVKHGSIDKAKEELVQVAAMCIRFIMDSKDFRGS